MTTWKVEFFNEMVEEQTLAFPKAILADFLRVVELIEEFGPAIGRPHTDSSKSERKAERELAGQFSALSGSGNSSSSTRSSRKHRKYLRRKWTRP